MICANPSFRPFGAAILSRLGRVFMDITLHVGAHRTATTTFQHYMRCQSDDMDAARIGFWGPKRLRQTHLAGLFPGEAVLHTRQTIRRTEGRIQMQIALARAAGLRHLMVSDENMIGTMRHAIRFGSLYPAIGERMARISTAFGGQITRVVLSIRAQDIWWASAAAFTVARGHPVPDAPGCERIAASPRTWRDVITDLACAVPEAEICVLPFESFAGRPDAVLSAAIEADAPRNRQQAWLNRSPDMPALRALLAERGTDPDVVPDGTGRWQPFSREQTAALSENYADDLHWLIAGADDLARLIQFPTRTQTGSSLHAGVLTEGRPHDHRQENLARPG